ncbi:hypothetical protein OROMI_001498 [Orobanche minor]
MEVVKLGPLLNHNQRESFINHITKEEVLAALKSIGDDKAPESDGFSSRFFKSAWEIIGPEVTKVVQDFFHTGKLLKSVNVTVLTLIPKTNSASTIKEFRPIACCSFIYKLIYKILTTRMAPGMSYLINEVQAAFIPGRVIHDHNILAQELIRGDG